MTHIHVEGRTLELSSLDKVLWPEAGFTKGDMVAYYRAIAPVLLPHVAGRPVTLARFPEGVAHYGWYQTNCRGHPPWIETRRAGTQDYCVIDDLAGLLWAANMGTVELHPLLARGDRIDEATAVVFDLDPGPAATIIECCRVALAVRGLAQAAGLETFAKTSGWLGLHVHAPLNSGASFAVTKSFAREIAQRLADEHPAEIVAKPSRALRGGKVFIDWGQNAPTKSTIAPYSLRATAWPLVSAPLTWDEVAGAADRADPDDLAFGPAAVLARVERSGDLFAPVASLRQCLPDQR